MLGLVMVNLADISTKAGEPVAARDFALAALEHLQRTLGPEHADVAYALVALSEVELAAGRPDAAVDPAARALKLRETTEVPEQDLVAQALSGRRHELGALDFDLAETRVRFVGDALTLTAEGTNRARSLIQNLMIAANGVVARFLDAHGSPSIRRVVQAPARWDRIATIAAGLGTTLPSTPDSPALAAFLRARRRADPRDYAELSQSIIKLIGAGEYRVDTPDTDAPGHFALAVKDYAHSTAPNRRYSDLLTQRLLRAVLGGAPSPYSVDELTHLAYLCTRREDDANRVERQVRSLRPPCSWPTAWASSSRRW